MKRPAAESHLVQEARRMMCRFQTAIHLQANRKPPTSGENSFFLKVMYVRTTRLMSWCCYEKEGKVGNTLQMEQNGKANSRRKDGDSLIGKLRVRNGACQRVFQRSTPFLHRLDGVKRPSLYVCPERVESEIERR